MINVTQNRIRTEISRRLTTNLRKKIPPFTSFFVISELARTTFALTQAASSRPWERLLAVQRSRTGFPSPPLREGRGTRVYAWSDQAPSSARTAGACALFSGVRNQRQGVNLSQGAPVGGQIGGQSGDVHNLGVEQVGLGTLLDGNLNGPVHDDLHGLLVDLLAVGLVGGVAAVLDEGVQIGIGDVV